MDAAFKKKYKTEIEVLHKIGMDDDEIEDRLTSMDELAGWEAVTPRELQAMTEEELSGLMSYVWHDGRPRCDTIGITDLKVTQGTYSVRVEFSDRNSDPDFEVLDMDTKIHNKGDGEWNYGVYRKAK